MGEKKQRTGAKTTKTPESLASAVAQSLEELRRTWSAAGVTEEEGRRRLGAHVMRHIGGQLAVRAANAERQALDEQRREKQARHGWEQSTLDLLDKILQQSREEQRLIEEERRERREQLAQLSARTHALEVRMRQLQRPGRPSVWSTVLDEFDRRVKARDLGRNRNDTARALAAWLQSTHGKRMEWRTIANRLSLERKDVLDAQLGAAAARKSARRRRT